MAKDKGIMRRALLRARRLNKKQGYFTERDLEVYHGGLMRMVRYGIVEKAEHGYKLVDPSQDPVLQYKLLASQFRRKRRPRGDQLVAAKEIPHAPPPKNPVRIIPWGDDTFLITVGKRNFLAQEVTLTPLMRRLKRGEITE